MLSAEQNPTGELTYSKGYYLYYFIILEENKKRDILGFSSYKAEGSISFVFAISCLSLSLWYFLKWQKICLQSKERFVWRENLCAFQSPHSQIAILKTHVQWPPNYGHVLSAVTSVSQGEIFLWPQILWVPTGVSGWVGFYHGVYKKYKATHTDFLKWMQLKPFTSFSFTQNMH